MAVPYTPVTVADYNLNPPPDDGSQVVANRIDWSKHKEKLGDPLKTAIEAIDSHLTTAFAKVIGGGGVTTTAISYGISASDQGKLVKATAASITLTTPDAASVTSPFVCAVNNNSSGSITLDGNGSQTIDGQASITLGAGQGCFLFTDGTNWFTAGLGGIVAANQLGAGAIINGTIVESNATNAVTFAIKTLAGTDPTPTDPVIVAFRNVTAGTGNYVYRSITAATSIVIPSTATMGVSNGIPFRLWIGLLDNAGTVELFVINCLSGANIYALGQFPLITTTTIGTGSDNAHVGYSTTGRTSKAYVVLGYASYESGLATAGSWNASPTRLHLQGPNDPRPGERIQLFVTQTGTEADGGATSMPFDNTTPQNTEGSQVMTLATTPTSTANLLDIEIQAIAGVAGARQLTLALFQDTNANALSSNTVWVPNANQVSTLQIRHMMLAATTLQTTMKARMGGNSADAIYFNGSGVGTGIFNGTCNSFMRISEIMA